MSTVEFQNDEAILSQTTSQDETVADCDQLHRLREVRQQQGISVRSVARKMNVEAREVRTMEHPGTDLRLSTLYAWQEVLGVPIQDLLVEEEESLSAPIARRAAMVRLMKTATAIYEDAGQESIRRLAQMLMEQLTSIMPELESVGPWHTVGQQRTLDEYGRAADQAYSDDCFRGRAG